MKTKTIPVLLLLVILSSCNKKEASINVDNNKAKNDSLTAIIDSLKKPITDNVIKEVIKEKTFKEFIQEFIKEVPKSKSYFIENSESFIITNDYQAETTSNKVSSSSVYKEVNGFLKENNYSIKKDRLKYKDPYMLYEFVFRKDNIGNWKFYQINAGD